VRHHLPVYKWTCPICGRTKQGFGSANQTPVDKEAKNALLGHIRTSSGAGHGDPGVLPPGYDPDAAFDSIDIDKTRQEYTRGRGELTVDSPDISSLFRTLAGARRRYLLYFLVEESDGVAELDEVIKYLSSATDGETSGHRNSWGLETELYHRHFPQMEKSGIIEFDAHSETIRYRENELLEALLAQVVTYELTC
jgi:hypothetical protein